MFNICIYIYNACVIWICSHAHIYPHFLLDFGQEGGPMRSLSYHDISSSFAEVTWLLEGTATIHHLKKGLTRLTSSSTHWNSGNSCRSMRPVTDCVAWHTGPCRGARIGCGWSQFVPRQNWWRNGGSSHRNIFQTCFFDRCLIHLQKFNRLVSQQEGLREFSPNPWNIGLRLSCAIEPSFHGDMRWQSLI